MLVNIRLDLIIYKKYYIFICIFLKIYLYKLDNGLYKFVKYVYLMIINYYLWFIDNINSIFIVKCIDLWKGNKF